MADDREACQVCKERIPAIAGLVLLIEGDLRDAGDDNPRVHATSMLIKATIDRLIEEFPGDPAQVMAILIRSVHTWLIGGPPPLVAIELPTTEPEAQPTTKDVASMDVADLLQLKNLGEA